MRNVGSPAPAPGPARRPGGRPLLAVLALAAGFALGAAVMRLAPASALPPTRRSTAVVAVASAAGAASAGAGPTGSDVIDVVLTAALGAGMVGAALRAGPVVVTLAGVLAVLCSGRSTASAIAAGAALGLTAAVLATGRPAPMLLPVAGAGLAQAALRLAWPDVAGASAAAAALIVAPVLLAGLRRSPKRVRRIALRTAGVLVLASAAFSALGVVAALGARTSVDAGVQAARDGLEAVQRADRAGAAERFATAAAAFRRADGSVGAFWTRPALAVPIVGQHAKALRSLASAGADLAGAGSRAARDADPDDLRLAEGAFDLEAMAEVQRPLEEALVSLVRGRERLEDARSPFLAAPVADRLEELTDRIRSASGSAETAVLALRNAPGLLGADGPRRYFLAIQTPAEARASGGLIGNWGELIAEDGRITLGRFGRIQELNTGGDPAARRISGPADYVRRYSPFKPSLYWQTVTMSPDFPTVAQVIRELYPQSGGEAVDGVISLDPYAFAALLRLTGPVTVPGTDQQLTADNAVKLLLHDQYLAFDETAEAERVDFLDLASRTVFARLISVTLPSPRAVADVLAPAVAGRHFQLASSDPAEQRFFERIGAAGAVPPVRGDFVGLVTQNFNGNKIDWFLRRSYRYDAEFDPGTGDVSATLEVQLRNDAPAEGLPRSVIGYGGFDTPDQPQTAFGENLMLVSVYSPLELESMTVDDGQVLEISQQNELGRRVYSALVSVKSASTRIMTVELVGRVAPGDYRLDVLRQPTVTPDQAGLSATMPAGWEVRPVGTTVGGAGATTVSRRSATATVAVDRPRTLHVSVERGAGGLLDRVRRGR